MASTRASISKALKRPKINIIPPKQLFVDLTQDDTKTSSPKHQLSSPSAPNAPSKTPSTKYTSSSSIDYIPKSPTLSTSLSPNGYLNSSTSPPLRVSPPPPTQENASMDITLTLSPITLLDVQFTSPSPSPPIFGHPIPWNLLQAHGDSYDGDDVTIDATPLSTKSPTIVDYKIYKEGKKNYFQIIRADVKARFKKAKLVNYMDNFLLLNLKTMFEHHVEDNVWKNQQGLVKVMNWKLYDSCGVHCITMQNMLFYLLVEKIYLLTNNTLHQMFNDVKLQVDYECEMAFELVRLVKKQLKEGYVPK
ncbi:hypothetical protein Tco_0457846 [Tanacetum coccineum]